MKRLRVRCSDDGAGSALVLGVPVDDVTMDEAVAIVGELIVDGRAHGRTHRVATVNVDFIVNALRDPHLLGILQKSSLSIPDGMPVVWGSRLLATPVRERVAGADLVGALVGLAASNGYRISFFGGAPGIAQQAAELVRTQHEGVDVVADSGPQFGSVAELGLEALSELRDANPDVCCVAFGNPKQEVFIDRFIDELGIPVMIGVGGSLDFLVGAKRRAPGWMQRVGLEWLHRLLTEPRRLAGRYARDALVFLPRLASQAWTGRPASARGSARCAVDSMGDVLVDVRSLDRVDNTVAARIVTAMRAARRSGRTVELLGDPDRLRGVAGLRALVVSSATMRRD